MAVKFTYSTILTLLGHVYVYTYVPIQIHKFRIAVIKWEVIVLIVFSYSIFIVKVTGWQKMSEGNLSSWLAESRGVGGGGLESQSGRGSGGGGSLCRTSGLGMGLGRGRAPSFEALRGAVADLYRLDDFELTSLGAGFFSDVYKVGEQVICHL